LAEGFGDHDDRAKGRGNSGDRSDDPGRRAAVDAGLMHGGGALAALEQPPIHPEGGEPGHDESDRERAPEQLSTTSVIAIESVSDASAIGITAPSARPPRSSGRLVSE
jgi:hypothetical protein